MNVVSPEEALPRGIRAFTTTRAGGTSRGAFSSLNFAMHVPDEHQAVASNIQNLTLARDLPHSPRWLNQVHGAHTVDAIDVQHSYTVKADAVYTDHVGVVCAVMSADCIPLVLYDIGGQEIAAVHAGWKGLLNGIIESAVRKFSTPATRIGAWIGPGISRTAYVVGADFRQRFVRENQEFSRAFQSRAGQWHADLYAIAEQRLHESGVTKMSRYRGCTYGEPQRFYSARRDGITGRMATLVWIKSCHNTRVC